MSAPFERAPDVVSAGETLRPIRDGLLVEPLDFEPSKILDIVRFGRPLRGKVKAVGPGIYPKRYNGPKGVRTKSWDSKAFRPCDVKVGDTVQLGGLALGGYLFQTFMWGTKKHVICSERDVTAIENA